MKEIENILTIRFNLTSHLTSQRLPNNLSTYALSQVIIIFPFPVKSRGKIWKPLKSRSANMILFPTVSKHDSLSRTKLILNKTPRIAQDRCTARITRQNHPPPGSLHRQNHPPPGSPAFLARLPGSPAARIACCVRSPPPSFAPSPRRLRVSPTHRAHRRISSLPSSTSRHCFSYCSTQQ